ncbi:MAG TPA: dsRBD fold-containing protein [Jatrophihabitantaceae bacterium]|jgi:hypothetical protein
MKAQVGDHVVVASPTTGGPVRDGRIVEVRGEDGGPPYTVEWSDSRTTGLFYPGADAHVAATQEVAPSASRLRSWRVDIDLVEAGDETTAHAVLVAETARDLDALGEAHRNPSDVAQPRIGDEVAVARALRRLSDRLFETASSDMTGTLGHPAHLSR